MLILNFGLGVGHKVPFISLRSISVLTRQGGSLCFLKVRETIYANIIKSLLIDICKKKVNQTADLRKIKMSESIKKTSNGIKYQ